jgi:hypothetical protein
MNYITYEEASTLSLEWDNTKPLMVISFVDSHCESCQDFEELSVPEIEANGFKHYAIDLRSNSVPFPPSQTPTTYWYFANGMPPMVKKGAPPTKALLEESLNKMKRVYSGESTIEKEFF